MALSPLRQPSMSSDSLSIRAIAGLLDLFDTTLYGIVGNQVYGFSFETSKFVPKTAVWYAIYKDFPRRSLYYNVYQCISGTKRFPIQFFNPSTLQLFLIHLFTPSTLQ